MYTTEQCHVVKLWLDYYLNFAYSLWQKVSIMILDELYDTLTAKISNGSKMYTK